MFNVKNNNNILRQDISSPTTVAPKRSCGEPGAGVHDPIPLALRLHNGATRPPAARRRAPPAAWANLTLRITSEADPVEEWRRARQSALRVMATCDSGDLEEDDAFFAAALAVAATAPPL